MVALNEQFAPEKPVPRPKNRVGNFFGESAQSRRVNRLPAQSPRRGSGHDYGRTASGMFYYGFRYYNPETGRWLSRDPIGERGGLNLYGFVGNNPIRWFDLLGLSVYDDPCPKCSDVVSEINRVADLRRSYFDSMSAEGCPISGKNRDLLSLDTLSKVGTLLSLGSTAIETATKLQGGGGIFNPNAGDIAYSAKAGNVIRTAGTVATAAGTGISIYQATTADNNCDRVSYSASAIGGAVSFAIPVVGFATGIGGLIIGEQVNATEDSLNRFDDSGRRARCANLNLLAAKASSQIDSLFGKSCVD